MISVKPLAQFRADFPSDVVEDDGGIVQFGGKNVAEAIAQILSRLGCRVSDPMDAGEHGWELDIKCEKIPLWAQVTDLNPIYYFILEDNSRLFGKSNHPSYLRLIKILHKELELDLRFHNISWYDKEDYNMKMPFDAPVIGEIPEIRVTKLKTSFLDKLLAPFKPLPLKWD
jgi:hypothetical protein